MSLFVTLGCYRALCPPSNLLLSSVNSKEGSEEVTRPRQSKNCINFPSRKFPSLEAAAMIHHLTKIFSDLIPSASPMATSPTTTAISPVAMSPATKSMPPPPKKSSATPTRRTRSQKKELPPIPATVAPEAAVAPEAGEILSSESAELHLFDVASGAFTLQDREVVVTVTEVGQWQCKFMPFHISRTMSFDNLMYRLVAN